MHYKLRDKVAPPNRYAEPDDDPPSPGIARLVHPAVPFNPNLPRAAFPTLDPFDPLPRATATSTDVSRSNLPHPAPARNETPKKALVFHSSAPAPSLQRARRESESLHPNTVIENWLDQFVDPMEPGEFEQDEDWWDTKSSAMKALPERMRFGDLPDNMQYILFNEIQKVSRHHQDNAEVLLNMKAADRDHVIDICMAEQVRAHEEKIYLNKIVELSRAGFFKDSDHEDPGAFSDKLFSGLKPGAAIDSLVSRKDIRLAETYLKQEELLDVLKGQIRSYLGINNSDREEENDSDPSPEQEAPVEQDVPAPAPRAISSRLQPRQRPRSGLVQEYLADTNDPLISAPQDDANDSDFELKKGGNRRQSQTAQARTRKRQKTRPGSSRGCAGRRNANRTSNAQGMTAATEQPLGDMQPLPAHATPQTRATSSPMRLTVKVGSSPRVDSLRNIEDSLGRQDNTAEEYSAPELTDRESTPESAVVDTPQYQSPTPQPALQASVAPAQNVQAVSASKDEKTKRRRRARPTSAQRSSGIEAPEAPVRKSNNMWDVPEGDSVSTKPSPSLQSAHNPTPTYGFPLNNQIRGEVRAAQPRLAGMDVARTTSPMQDSMSPPEASHRQPAKARSGGGRFGAELNVSTEQDENDLPNRALPRRNKRPSRKSAENPGLEERTD